MEVSRLTFTKETQEKMNKPLNHFQRGELRWKRIKECEANGKLGKARNRMDIVEMLGGARTYGAIYSWTCNMISRGHIKETLSGIGKDGKMEYEYSVIKSPNFTPAPNAQKIVKPKKAAIVVPTTPPVVLDGAVVESSKAKITVRYKELSIELEDISREIVEAIIEKLATVAGQ